MKLGWHAAMTLTHLSLIVRTMIGGFLELEDNAWYNFCYNRGGDVEGDEDLGGDAH